LPPDAATAPATAHSAAPASGSADKLLQRLEWTSLRRLEGLLQGDYRTLMRGVGLDLADLREYQLHDDVRHIDWNVTARLQQPHVRQFTEDREMTVWFLLDLSASVDFGSGDRTKRQTSAELVGTLARPSRGMATAWVPCCMAMACSRCCPRAVAGAMCCTCCKA